ncbi:tetratricopeptide repeat protein [Sphingomonas sp. LB-2]|uniref:tetratricopeptide repeat protein n=1 Tax=Sphingomonas caeni TaxID=2984949 RepID=UPI0022301428|nr:tetratricopeptide repeat protein [Sphingomonas caeni]MCW3847883.1 tetratricopeptide repeat protein [Sphingomonas caeni]
MMRLASALVFAPLIGGIARPAQAQSQSIEINGKRLSLSSEEAKALGAVSNTIPGRNRPLQDNALARARSIVKSPDARHVLALYELEIGTQRGDNAMRIPALDVLIASDLTSAQSLASYLSVRGGIAFDAHDFATANTLWTRLLAMKPDDPDALANLAQVRIAQNDPAGAIDLIERAIAKLTAAHRPVSEALYRQRLSIANQAKLARPAFAAALDLVRAYPNPRNWRDALVVYRQIAQPQGGLEIDLLQLMRAVGALTQPAEYQRLAQLLTHAGRAAEARKVLDEGEARDVIPALDLLTRQIRAEIDREIATGRGQSARPDADPAATSLHRAMALAAAGNRDEAQSAFRALAAQPGGYGELAGFWLAWLEQLGR